nr:MAG TPA: hypothetical protein [Caudoviricetes sp.]
MVVATICPSSNFWFIVSYLSLLLVVHLIIIPYFMTIRNSFIWCFLR